MDSNFLVNNNNSFQTYIQLSLKEWLLVNGKIIEEDKNRILNVRENILRRNPPGN